MALPTWLADDEATASFLHRPGRAAACAPYPAWVSDRVRAALAARGVAEPWRHQVEAAEAAFAGRHVAVATGTASGKTVAYLLPILAAAVDGRLGWCPAPGAGGVRQRLGLPDRHTALYLAPTKALAHDQFRVCAELGLRDLRACTLDGDSGPEERRFAREHAGFVLSNPDMLHRSLLPAHQRWARFLGGLRYVVIDEAHRYRGVFGAHVAMVLRRLRRLCLKYGADPRFVFASATIAEADAVGRALAGVDNVTLVDADASPAAALDFVLRRPSPTLTQDAAALLARLAGSGQTLAFTTSRLQAELVALRARDLAAHPESIAAYRGGYLAEDRRALEAQLQSGRLRGVACTNALELGVDISGMDAVVSVGFPGTLAALWQQVGRAGRTGRSALAVLLAREDPLDAYLVEHPELVFARPVERTVLDPDNPYVLGPHLAAAAQEAPLTAADSAFFGPHLEAVADQLTRQGVLRRRPAGWFWPHAHRAVDAIDLRSMEGRVCEVVDEATGCVIGQVDPAAADRTLHPEAVYVHQGEPWLVREFDAVTRVATAVRTGPDYFTQPLSEGGVRIVDIDRSRTLGLGTVSYGAVELTSQVTGYLRRDAQTGEVWDQSPLDLPIRRMVTKAVWWTLPPDVADALDIAPAELPGAVHATEHAGIGLLPAVVPCDRWDIGGLSTVAHPDTGRLTVFVHDGVRGGSGFAAQGYATAESWWRAVFERLTSCRCEDGCPACVVSPTCGSGNASLDKRGAAELVRVLTLG
nr:DEAD/DEAH box helicase [Propionibacterium sp.]